MNAITPLQRWKRDDWTIPCTLRDTSGSPVDLTGSTLGAELWLAGYSVFQPLTVANGGIVRVSDPAGQFTVIASRLLTAQAPGDAAALLPGQRTRVLIYKIDTLGRRQTLGIIFFDVFDASDTRLIDEIPSAALVSQSTTLQLFVAREQGAPGPSQIGAAQITDGGDAGRAILRATDAKAILQFLGVVAVKRTPVADLNYLVKPTDTFVAYTALTAPRTVTLCQASAYGDDALYVGDLTPDGKCSTDRPIIVAAAGNDTIAGQPSVVIASPYQKLAFHSNGSNLWTL